ncbi:hypothetical protein KIN20_001538 [Parelaphostrongylus tenuis]|uniref:Uncharacterized protein n=1 Tax=Parelaphostrongylus tenuis TaxID=148309 RepID=A0AAD5LX43_PARTN|nr:hypothetical protein KIN20_001538 [Parelaphostrongylus tenuis]
MAERDERTPVSNSPSAYNDEVPLTPLVCRDRERQPTTSRDLWSSYRSSLRDSVQTTAGSAQKEHHDRGCDRASRRPADRSPQWKSRQDALLLENPSPPLTPRRIARSPRGTPLRSPYHSPHHSPDHSQYDLSGSNYGWRSLTCSTPIRLPPHPYFQVGNGDQFASRTTTSLSTVGLGAFPQHALLPTYRGFLPFLYPRCPYQPYAVPPTIQAAAGQLHDAPPTTQASVGQFHAVPPTTQAAAGQFYYPLQLFWQWEERDPREPFLFLQVSGKRVRERSDHHVAEILIRSNSDVNGRG